MAKQNINIDYELITKYLSGETTLRESEMVESWIDASDTNAQSFEQLKKLWEETGKIVDNEPAEVDIDEAWKNFRARAIDKESLSTKTFKKEPKSKERSLIQYIARIAAIFVIGIAIYTIFKNIINESSKIQLTASKEIITDTLPDASIVSLNAKSHIEYSQKFKKNTRTVSLSGEAYFEIEPNQNKPFIVKTSNASVEVLGTSFYVRAYDSLPNIEVGVEEGQVLVNSTKNDISIELTAKESLIFDKITGEVEPKEPFDPNALFWKTNILIFQNSRLSEVFNTLENQYNIQIKVVNSSVLNCRLTAKFSREDIDQIMNIINTNFNLNSEYTNNQFTIYGEGCN